MICRNSGSEYETIGGYELQKHFYEIHNYEIVDYCKIDVIGSHKSVQQCHTSVKAEYHLGGYSILTSSIPKRPVTMQKATRYDGLSNVMTTRGERDSLFGRVPLPTVCSRCVGVQKLAYGERS